MTACFLHEASKATIVHALQQRKMVKSFHVMHSLTTHGRTLKNCMGVALDFLTQYEEDGNDLLEQIILALKAGSIFIT